MAGSDRSHADSSPMARTIADATDRGIRSARSHDLAGFGEAVDTLVIHAEAARAVHAQLVRELLETAYQDGLDGDDVADVLNRTVSDARRWNAPADPAAVATVLTGALGVTEHPDTSDGATPIPSSGIAAAAILVAADLAADAGFDHGPYLARAVEEIRRAQTVEMP